MAPRVANELAVRRTTATRSEGAPRSVRGAQLDALIIFIFETEAVPRRLRERAYPAAAVAGSPVAEERRRGQPPVRPETLRGVDSSGGCVGP